MRKTKIICTLGPASADDEVLVRMAQAGMNVARLNFSHGTHAEHAAKIAAVKRVREALGMPIAIMLDTKGPEYRIGAFKDGKAVLKKGCSFVFTAEEVMGDESRVSVSYKNMVGELKRGDVVLVDNGLMAFEVEAADKGEARCRVLTDGTLSDRKSMNFPGKVLGRPYLSEQDKADLRFGVQQGVDFIACSFVSGASDLRVVREFLTGCGGESADLIAKIENRAGVDNIEEILEAADGIMIARGDMGVEIPFEELPAIQKKLIEVCRTRGKRVITATEMLESMITNPRPTRAEISDVANAVYDGTSAVMLSGETAVGKFPALTVTTMAKIAAETERNIDYKERLFSARFKIKNHLDALSHATCGVAADIGARAIVVCTRSGMTARMVSRFRPPIDIVGLTTDEAAYRKLALSWGVIPVLSAEFSSVDELFRHAASAARRILGLERGDSVVITGGLTDGRVGNTDLIKTEVLR